MMEQRNLLLAIVFSVAVLLGYQFLFEQPRIERERAAQQAAEAERRAAGETVEPARPATPPRPGTGAVLPGVPGGTAGLPQAPAVAPSAPPAATEPRVQIVSSRLKGSLSLKGARIDDLLLTDYRETIEEDSPQITLFAPPGSEAPYFAQFGWVATDTDVATPTPETVWTSPRGTLEPGAPAGAFVEQRSRARLHPGDHPRPGLHVQGHPAGDQPRRSLRRAQTLRADLAHRRAGHAGLLDSCTRGCSASSGKR